MERAGKGTSSCTNCLIKSMDCSKHLSTITLEHEGWEEDGMERCNSCEQLLRCELLHGDASSIICMANPSFLKMPAYKTDELPVKTYYHP